MLSEVETSLIDRAAAILRNAKNTYAFTGAGISTDSGIPDFRSPSSGLWENVDPLAVASIYGFRRDPQAFYNWVRGLAQLTVNAQPNPAHLALAEMERRGYLNGIITQNIDMLHTRAGSTKVFELHGHMRQATCISCFAVADGEQVMRQFLDDGLIPRCDKCSSVLKPNVILFGEQLPIRELNGAQDAARKCDAMVIIGSSLEVAPASDIPVLAKRNGAKLVIINLDPTPLDAMADVVIHERAALTLPEIIRRLE